MPAVSVPVRLLQMALMGLSAFLFIALAAATECYECATPATVRDPGSPAAGCGPVLELATGERLEPDGPLWLRFPKAEGQRVRVGYRPRGASNCLVGLPVEITCIVAAPAERAAQPGVEVPAQTMEAMGRRRP